MKSFEMKTGVKRLVAVSSAALALAACTPGEKTEAVSSHDAEIVDIREAPVPSGTPETAYTRGMECSLEAARIAIGRVMAEQQGSAQLDTPYFIDPSNKQSSYVLAEQIAPGTTKLKLEVILQPDGELFRQPSDDVGYMVRGGMTLMQTTNESWLDALQTTRADQIGLPEGGIAVWTPADGGTINQPEELCRAVDELKQATE